MPSISISIAVNVNRAPLTGSTIPFSGTQWQLLTVTAWENITDTWN